MNTVAAVRAGGFGPLLRVIVPDPFLDPVTSAEIVGLQYVSDQSAGFRRVKRGKGFGYVDTAGRPLRAAPHLRRIRTLVIPPAWTEVWICAIPNGHLQATGRDQRGRKQYRYHPHYRACRDETKFGRMIAFGRALPAIRRRVAHDLKLPRLPRAKVLATVVRLLEITRIRIGNEEYAQQNHSYGLTTLRNRHVAIRGSTVQFAFRGKSGRKVQLAIDNPRLARIVKRCRDLPGQELFQYVDDAGARRPVDSADVNDYLREITGQDFSAKDFRTWAGTVLAARALCACGPCDVKTQANRNVVAAIDQVASRLNNTRAVCRKCYIHPAVLEAYLDGSWFEEPGSGASSTDVPRRGLSGEEKRLLRFLKKRAKLQGAALAKSLRK